MLVKALAHLEKDLVDIRTKKESRTYLDVKDDGDSTLGRNLPRLVSSRETSEILLIFRVL